MANVVINSSNLNVLIIYDDCRRGKTEQNEEVAGDFVESSATDAPGDFKKV